MCLPSGSFHPCPALTSFFFHKLGGALIKCEFPNKYRRQNQKLEKKVTEAIKQRAASRKRSFRSMNSIIMRFPHFKDGLGNIKDVFEQYDEDSNGTIDLEELKKCLSTLQVHLTEEEINGLYHYCDVDGNEGIQVNEFIILLCLIYLLMEPASATDRMSRIGSPQVEATFDAIVDAFLFLDKNGDGKIKRKDMMLAFNETTTKEKSPKHITLRRFKEMDWNKKGKVNFKEFLFSFTKWIGMDADDQESLE
ncbi:probable calcium-binding protein CML22 [Elaeis guineensis]|uniref:probable calcium-binding protein CML22 n=1 Tax=Elaeis guineensis var. tenera TaxID=51953 RepID=UPI003C6CE8B5